MNFGSLFSGIGGFDLALERVGMECAWQVEINRHCLQVLATHWPNVPKYKDVKDVGRHNLSAVDLVVGGFPCQDLSVAGNRAGLAGERSGLWFEFHRVLAELEPRWVVIENVPGLLSSNGGRDFAVLLRGLVQLRYGVCWRVLDAQYEHLAQRRKRVFIVGHLGDGRAAEVLFESESGTWDPPPIREAEKGAAPYAPNSFGGYSEQLGTLRHNHGDCGGGSEVLVAPTLSGHNYRKNGVAQLTGGRPDAIAFDRTQSSVSGDLSAPLRACGGQAEGVNDGKADAQCVAYGLSENQRAEVRLTEYSRQITSGGGKPGQGYPCVAFAERSRGGGRNLETSNEIAFTLQNPSSGGTTHSKRIATRYGVRRLTPTECCRLQGFPDDWNAELSDTQRYKQLGNAVAVPVIEWIGRRLLYLAQK